jgi:hypothetical protein
MRATDLIASISSGQYPDISECDALLIATSRKRVTVKTDCAPRCLGNRASECCSIKEIDGNKASKIYKLRTLIIKPISATYKPYYFSWRTRRSHCYRSTMDVERPFVGRSLPVATPACQYARRRIPATKTKTSFRPLLYCGTPIRNLRRNVSRRI